MAVLMEENKAFPLDEKKVDSSVDKRVGKMVVTMVVLSVENLVV